MNEVSQPNEANPEVEVSPEVPTSTGEILNSMEEVLERCKKAEEEGKDFSSLLFHREGDSEDLHCLRSCTNEFAMNVALTVLMNLPFEDRSVVMLEVTRQTMEKV